MTWSPEIFQFYALKTQFLIANSTVINSLFPISPSNRSVPIHHQIKTAIAIVHLLLILTCPYILTLRKPTFTEADKNIILKNARNSYNQI